MSEHSQGLIVGFTKKYQCKYLIYYENFSQVKNAIMREKEIKGWKRFKKENLINSINPKWEDLSKEWIQILRFAQDDITKTYEISSRNFKKCWGSHHK